MTILEVVGTEESQQVQTDTGSKGEAVSMGHEKSSGIE